MRLGILLCKLMPLYCYLRNPNKKLYIDDQSFYFNCVFFIGICDRFFFIIVICSLVKKQSSKLCSVIFSLFHIVMVKKRKAERIVN